MNVIPGYRITIELKKIINLLNTTKDDRVKSAIYKLVNDELIDNENMSIDYQNKYLIVDKNGKEVEL